jgi:hypothetical protein
MAIKTRALYRLQSAVYDLSPTARYIVSPSLNSTPDTHVQEDRIPDFLVFKLNILVIKRFTLEICNHPQTLYFSILVYQESGRQMCLCRRSDYLPG